MLEQVGGSAAFAAVAVLTSTALHCGSDLVSSPVPDDPELVDATVQNSSAPPETPAAACWSSTSPIAFISNRAGPTDWQLYLMAPDGSAVRRIARGQIRAPAWSPDGRSIAFREHHIDEYDREYVTELAIIDPDGYERVSLLFEASGVAARVGEYSSLDGPSWSADGKRLAFASRRGGRWQIWQVPVAGGAPTPLLPAVEDEQLWPSWAPVDAYRIAVVLGDTTRDIWVLDVRDPGRALNVTRGRVEQPEAPRWSPDERRLAFSARSLTNGGDAREIFVVDVEGEELVQLTSDDMDDLQPVWSPDGSQLLFSSNRARLDQEGRAAGTDPVDLWLAPLDSPAAARAITSGRGGHGIGDWAWTSACGSSE